MAYATQADVLPLIRRVNLTATSTVTLADLDTFLAQRAAQIDAVLLSRGISVPLTAPATFLTALVALNAKGAAADVMNAFYITSDGNDRGAGAIYLKEFTDTLKAYVNGDGIPVGAAVAESDLAVRSPWTGPTGCPPVPMFRREGRPS